MLKFSHRVPPVQSVDEHSQILRKGNRERDDPDVLYEMGLESLRRLESHETSSSSNVDTSKAVRESARVAAHWLMLAAKAGHAKAEYLVSVMAKEGEGMPPCWKKYVFYLTQAARHGQAHAQVELGRLCIHGTLVSKDLVRARDLFLQAAFLKNADACKELARLAATGRGVVGEALVWWEKAAKAGDAEAMYESARLYIGGNSGDVSQTKGVDLLRKALQANYPRALWAYGELLREPGRLGSVVRRDCAKAASCLGEACKGWKAQAAALSTEQRTAESRHLCAMVEFDQVIDSCSTLQRCLHIWTSTVNRKRSLLERCARQYVSCARRNAFARWVSSSVGTQSDRIKAEDPVGAATLRIRFLHAWKMCTSVAASQRRERLKYFQTTEGPLRTSRATFRSWAQFVCGRQVACRQLVASLNRGVMRQLKVLPEWRLGARRRKATVLMVRCLRRSVQRRIHGPTMNTWRRWIVSAKVIDVSTKRSDAETKLKTLNQMLAQYQDMHACEIASLQRRLAQEKSLNSQLEELNALKWSCWSQSKHTHTASTSAGYGETENREVSETWDASRSAGQKPMQSISLPHQLTHASADSMALSKGGDSSRPQVHVYDEPSGANAMPNALMRNAINLPNSHSHHVRSSSSSAMCDTWRRDAGEWRVPVLGVDVMPRTSRASLTSDTHRYGRSDVESFNGKNWPSQQSTGPQVGSRSGANFIASMDKDLYPFMPEVRRSKSSEPMKSLARDLPSSRVVSLVSSPVTSGIGTSVSESCCSSADGTEASRLSDVDDSIMSGWSSVSRNTASNIHKASSLTADREFKFEELRAKHPGRPYSERYSPFSSTSSIVGGGSSCSSSSVSGMSSATSSPAVQFRHDLGAFIARTPSGTGSGSPGRQTSNASTSSPPSSQAFDDIRFESRAAATLDANNVRRTVGSSWGASRPSAADVCAEMFSRVR